MVSLWKILNLKTILNTELTVIKTTMKWRLICFFLVFWGVGLFFFCCFFCLFLFCCSLFFFCFLFFLWLFFRENMFINSIFRPKKTQTYNWSFLLYLQRNRCKGRDDAVSQQIIGEDTWINKSIWNISS